MSLLVPPPMGSEYASVRPDWCTECLSISTSTAFPHPFCCLLPKCLPGIIPAHRGLCPSEKFQVRFPIPEFSLVTLDRPLFRRRSHNASSWSTDYTAVHQMAVLPYLIASIECWPMSFILLSVDSGYSFNPGYRPQDPSPSRLASPSGSDVCQHIALRRCLTCCQRINPVLTLPPRCPHLFFLVNPLSRATHPKFPNSISSPSDSQVLFFNT